MGNISNDLQWKNDNPFWFTLDKDLAQLRDIAFKAKIDLKYLQAWLAYLETLADHYSDYTDKKGNMGETLTKASKTILSVEFDVYINNPNDIRDVEKKKEIHEKILESIKDLRAVHKTLMTDLYDRGLRAKFYENSENPGVTKKT